MRQRWGGGLGIIFSFFLGVMITAFVGVGVYTFHAPPEEFDPRIRDLGRREQAIRNSRPENELTTEDRAQIQEINRERDQLVDAAAAARIPWGRSTSIVLITLATLTMAVSLVRADELPVISNGLLLGGVFTMLYGVGWIIATDTSMARFLVITAALAITLALGYVRFVRGQALPSGVPSGAVSDGLGDVERRLRDLEERMHRAANAFGSGGDAREG